MWVLVMFDLPVDTDEAVKAANGFRNALLDLGFERCQYSVYLRFVEGRDQADTTTRRVQAVLLRIPTMPAGDSNRSRPLIPTQAGHPSEGVERGWGIMGSVRSGRSSPGCRACAATRPGA